MGTSQNMEGWGGNPTTDRRSTNGTNLWAWKVGESPLIPVLRAFVSPCIPPLSHLALLWFLLTCLISTLANDTLGFWAQPTLPPQTSLSLAILFKLFVWGPLCSQRTLEVFFLPSEEQFHTLRWLHFIYQLDWAPVPRYLGKCYSGCFCDFGWD